MGLIPPPIPRPTFSPPASKPSVRCLSALTGQARDQERALGHRGSQNRERGSADERRGPREALTSGGKRTSGGHPEIEIPARADDSEMRGAGPSLREHRARQFAERPGMPRESARIGAVERRAPEGAKGHSRGAQGERRRRSQRRRKRGKGGGGEGGVSPAARGGYRPGGEEAKGEERRGEKGGGKSGGTETTDNALLGFMLLLSMSQAVPARSSRLC